jgi:ribosomal protein S18 acetylase RimI-like enzyme
VRLNDAGLRAVQALLDEYHLLAADVTERYDAQFLRNDDTPTRYDGNHVRCIRGADVDGLFAAVEHEYGHLPYRAVRVDPYTPHAVEARLLADDYVCSTEIVMVASGELTGEPANIDIRAVPHDADALAHVVAVDDDEGRPDYRDSAEPWREVWALIQRRGDAFKWYVAFDGERPVGHFSQRTRGGIGYLESLFVDPEYRKRGIGTALTHQAAAAARADGAQIVFLPADADDWPKHMYRRMGFEPAYQFRNYRRDVQ